VNVLVIPEDHRKDQYILKPIVEAMMRRVGQGTAKVCVLSDPCLGGVDQALTWDVLKDVIDARKWHVDVFLLCVDRDGDADRRTKLNRIERLAERMLHDGSKFFVAENAWQEVEVWALAGHTMPTGWNWRAVRSEIHPKETYFLPFAKQRGLLSEPGEGRQTLAEESARRWNRVRDRCPEIAAMESRIRDWLE
jgi:hypothetical protein